MDDVVVYSGRSRTIEWAVLPGAKMPARREWEDLEKRQKAQLLATIERLGDEPAYANTERFKKESGRIFAMKAYQVRAYCFFASVNRLVVTNIVVKKRDKAKKADLERAERIRQECVNP